MRTGAELLVKCLEENDVEFIFGIPGAKIDSVFDALCDSKIRLILCRHEQNAAFMAGAYGRLTGKPGIVVVTSGPGVGNLVTGLLTATTEGDPIIAIGGCVPRPMLLKESHQNTDNTKILEAATKSSVSINDVRNIPETIENAFRIALANRRGSCFISIPQDVLLDKTDSKIINSIPIIQYGSAPIFKIAEAVSLIEKAKLPILFLGGDASLPENTNAIRFLIEKQQLPVISTYQGAGVVSRDLISNFVGRVGLFRNQPGDKLLEKSDLVITIGFSAVEYDPDIWNKGTTKTIINIDNIRAKVQSSFIPEIELIGEISSTVISLASSLNIPFNTVAREIKSILHEELMDVFETSSPLGKNALIHPIDFIRAFRELVNDDDLVTCDIGSVYIWMARYFFVYNPRQIIFSNGQQTLGVAMPWALAGKLAFPDRRVFAISGDGGFLFSSMELETAVREKIKFIQFIWRDGTYNMVLEQQELKYNRRSGVDFGSIDIECYAKSFGAKGFVLNKIEDFDSIVKEALNSEVPVLIDVPIDYSNNRDLFIGLNDVIK